MAMDTLRRPARAARPTIAVPRSSAERLWLIGGGVVTLLITAMGFLLVISPQRAATDRVHGKLAGVQHRNATLEQRLAQLRQQNQNLASFERQLAAAREALPTTSNVSDFLRSLQALGGQTQTEVTSLGVSAPSPVPTPTAAPVAGAAKAPAPAGPVQSLAGLYSLTTTVQLSGSPANLARFLDQLQNVQPRAVLITQVQESTGASGTVAGAKQGSTTLQLTLQAFIAPPAAALPSPSAPTATGGK
jgi:type II secretory pathway component PulM